MKDMQMHKDEERKRLMKLQIGLALAVLYVLAIFMITLPVPKTIIAQDWHHNTTIKTYLNISNAAPIISDVIIYDNDSEDLSSNIQLNPGNLEIVTCNGTVNDSNGWGDISNVNATIFFIPNASSAPDRNVKYVNQSCNLVNGDGPNSAVASCTFGVYFFANNGTWNCTMYAVDNQSVVGNGSAEEHRIIDPLYAFDLSDTSINYGTVNVTFVSEERNLNITNAGNMNINLSVEGYGSDLEDSLAMNCSYGSYINVSYERYALFPGGNFSANMTNLTTTPLLNGISNLTILQNEDDAGNVTQDTYWRIQAPYGVQTGSCNGSLLFAAIPA